MRQLLLGLCLLLPLQSFAQEIPDLKEYSYTELVDMIKAEEDTIFRLSNAKIYFEPKTDSLFLINQGNTNQFVSVGSGLRKDTLHIYKDVHLEGVEFGDNVFRRMYVGFSKVKFHKSLFVNNPQSFFLNNSVILGDFGLGQDKAPPAGTERFIRKYLYIKNSTFKGSGLVLFCQNESEASIFFRSNKVVVSENVIFQIEAMNDLYFKSNDISTDRFALIHQISEGLDGSDFEVLNNSVKANSIGLNLNTPVTQSIKLAKNIWDSPSIALTIDDFSAKSLWINWDQFKNKLIDADIYTEWMSPMELSAFDKRGFIPTQSEGSYLPLVTKRNIDHYREIVRVQDVDIYNVEQALRGQFYDFYKGRHEISAANDVYIEIKDLETQRLKYLYGESPSFKTYFKWRINQFLKIFSAYGTEPERAISFSVYVILAFAIVYLFFPNYWDSHGKKRIMDRYRFFTRYMKKDTGMHDVYLEDKQPELMASEDFKVYMQASAHEIPKFFINTALPLYRWSIAGTKSASWLLSKVDVLKGKWSDTEPSKQGGKSVLLIGTFLIALLYDIFIKMLNALMLSINTFTTLGFGEIPIKGLPRYLAIIQGFIGWFMLTIFSVSLISQLLN